MLFTLTALLLCFYAALVATEEVTLTSYTTITAFPVVPSADNAPFTSTSSAASPQYTSPSDFQSSILNSTNTFRHQHNASFLQWNDTLAKYAADHAEQCNFQHSHGLYGENLAIGYENITSAIDAWGNERSDFHFDSEGFSEQTGHFTQLVWKDTTSTGCGAHDCGSKGWLLFCEYWPAGNVDGEYNDQVQKALPGSGVDVGGEAGRYVQYLNKKINGATTMGIVGWQWLLLLAWIFIRASC